jgi:PPM family protein phosphatase
VKYQLAYHSLAGGRATNQDRVVCAERDNAVLMVLADGLGGHEGGALAAEILTQTALHAFEAVRQPVITKPSAFLALTIMQAHKTIFARGHAQVPPISPRTTCGCVWCKTATPTGRMSAIAASTTFAAARY